MSVEERRRRREELMVLIRESRSQDMSMMLRVEDLQDDSPSSSASQKKMSDLDTSIAKMKSNDHSASEFFRTIILSVSHSDINEMILTQRLPPLVSLLKESAFPKLQVEVAWALENLTSRSAILSKALITCDAIPKIIPLLTYLPEQITQILGNIAGSSIECRDFLILSQALNRVSDLVNLHIPLSLSKSISRAFEQFCRGKPKPKFELVRSAIRALRVLLLSTDDEDVLKYSSWAYSYISYNPTFKSLCVADAETIELLKRLITLLRHSSRAVIIPTLTTIANMVIENSELTQCVLENDVLPILAKLLEAKFDILLLDKTCWLISMFTSGSEQQIQAVINHNLIPTLVELADSAEPESKKAAVFALSNAAAAAFPDQIMYLVEKGSVKPLCSILSCEDPSIIDMALEGIQNILSVGVAKGMEASCSVNMYAAEFDAVEGHQKILSLTQQGTSFVREKAAALLKEYWRESETEDEDED